MLKIFRSKEAG